MAANLYIVSTAREALGTDVPFVQALHEITPCSYQDSNQVHEHRLPYTKLKLMHQVGHEQLINIQPELCELCGECALMTV